MKLVVKINYSMKDDENLIKKQECKFAGGGGIDLLERFSKERKEFP